MNLPITPAKQLASMLADARNNNKGATLSIEGYGVRVQATTPPAELRFTWFCDGRRIGFKPLLDRLERDYIENHPEARRHPVSLVEQCAALRLAAVDLLHTVDALLAAPPSNGQRQTIKSRCAEIRVLVSNTRG